MKKLRLTIEINELDGFNDEVFLSIVQGNLSEVGAVLSEYEKIDVGYRFEVSFKPTLSEYPFQPILGCFSSISAEYDEVQLIGIPSDKIEYIDED